MEPTKTNRLIHNIEDTRKILGNVGRTLTYELIKNGELKKVKIGSRSFITDGSIRAYVRKLEGRAA